MDPKERIIKYACQRFMMVGIRNVTMDSIALELSVSKRTIYEYFSNKDTLVIESMRYLITENNKELVKIIENTENVIEAIFLITQRQQQWRKEFPMVFREDIKKYFPMVQSSFYSCKNNLKQFSASFTLLEKGIRDGVFRKDLMIELVDNFIHEIISVVHTSERIRLLNPEDNDILNNIFLPYIRGICTAKGWEQMNSFFRGNLEIN